MNQYQPLHAQKPDALVMVVNKANTAAPGLSIAQARKLLLGEEAVWRTGAAVTVVFPPAGSPEKAAVLKKICGMTETIYTRYEMQAVFTGGTATKVAESASDAVTKNMVKANSGAVGFIHKSKVDDTVQAVFDIE